VDAVAVVEDEVRELVRRRGLDPDREPSRLRSLVEDVVADYDERSLLGTLPPLPGAGVVKAVLDAVGGLGPLQEHLDDPEVEEIWINEASNICKAWQQVRSSTSGPAWGVTHTVDRIATSPAW